MMGAITYWDVSVYFGSRPGLKTDYNQPSLNLL